MPWRIVLFETPRGEKPVEEFVKSLEPQTVAKVAHTIDLLNRYGSLLGMPHSKKLTNNLYELRVRGRQEARILYTIKQKTIYLLHAFRKQTEKTPPKELAIAQARLDKI